MKKLITLALLTTVTLLTGCDDSNTQPPTKHQIEVSANIQKLKNKVDHNFVYYNGDHDRYMMDIKTGCVYVNYDYQDRSALTFIEGSCDQGNFN